MRAGGAGGSGANEGKARAASGDAARPKPDHLGPEFASQFRDPAVVAAYHLRPPYPDETFDILADLLVAPGTALDVGAGTGEIARRLVGRAAAVDAVDPSTGMIARGRGLPGGDHPSLHWIVGTAEDAPLRPPYGLIVAAASLHWLDWPVALPRFRDLLAPGGVLAIVELRQAPNPWDGALQRMIDRYSTNRRFRPYDLVAELSERNLFQELGRRGTAPVDFSQSVADYVASFHARNGFSRDRMAPDDAAAFDRAVAQLVAPDAPAGAVELRVTGEVVWGKPAPLASRAAS
ncbi:MAG TPA: class I SAM-dependent methyltransferase [Thermomicrobiales bacterium]|nr:class I SAM-dependent methyltransferase [Thermomicrobiales bacterium]